MMRQHSPVVVADALADRMSLPRPEMAESTSWEDVYTGGISPEVLSSPQESHLPHADRRALTRTLRIGSGELLGPSAVEIEDLYETCIGRSHGAAEFAHDRVGPLRGGAGGVAGEPDGTPRPRLSESARRRRGCVPDWPVRSRRSAPSLRE